MLLTSDYLYSVRLIQLREARERKSWAVDVRSVDDNLLLTHVQHLELELLDYAFKAYARSHFFHFFSPSFIRSISPVSRDIILTYPR